MDDLLQEFIAETRETLEALAGEIVAWEADPADRARLDAIFRFVHTVKGSCGFLDLPRLARLSHAAEDILAKVRDGHRVPDTRLVSAVLAIVDRIGEIVEAIDGGRGFDDSGEELLIAALDGDTAATPIAAPHIPAANAPQRAPTRSVRLSVDLLDRMMSGMSDMVLARNELARRLRDADCDPAADAALERLSLTVAEMRETVTRTRMQTIDALFSALPRMVCDTAASVGKVVNLSIEGSDVELDREMIEMMRDPLVHIIRNSIDHGIEAPEDRRAAGKSEIGRLTVSARQSGNRIVVEVCDDGAGIDVDRVMAKLAANGVRDLPELRALSDQAKLGLIFEPGLSTKDKVTEISGRGVGMDVVKSNIEHIGGRIELDNSPGRGLRIAIHVPLTLSIMSTIIVGVGGQRFALPRQAIEEIDATANDAIRIDSMGDGVIAKVRGRRMPLVDLAPLLGQPRAEGEIGSMLAIVSVAGGSFALAVDTVLAAEELVVKPAAPAVMAAQIYGGQTLPDTGEPMLLLDASGIAAVANLRFDHAMAADEEEAAAIVEQGVSALLFVDLDNVRRAVPLAIVDRVENVAASSVRMSGGQLRLSAEGRIVPVVARGSMEGLDEIGVLRLTDGESVVAYAIAEALDIVTLPPEMAPVAEPGLIAGVALVEGEAIELIDPHWLFGEYGETELSGEPPLCLFASDASGWMSNVLKPVLEAAGYRVATAGTGETPAVVLAMEEDAVALDTPAPVVRLRRKKAGSEGSIYRYDREGVVAALAAAGGRR
ncbi:hypothetical protein BH09PSE4_BH09PSE4_21600 [soil metagenome]